MKKPTKKQIKKIRKLELALNDLIVAMDVAAYELESASKEVGKKLIETEHYNADFDDEAWLELMGADAFTLHCANIRNVIVSLMYCMNKPGLLQKIQQKILIESMKEEIKENDVPQEVIDDFLDFMNTVKSY